MYCIYINLILLDSMSNLVKDQRSTYNRDNKNKAIEKTNQTVSLYSFSHGDA